MWLIPLVWGWFVVGTHHGRRKQVVEKLRECSQNIELPANGLARPTSEFVLSICNPEGDSELVQAQDLPTDSFKQFRRRIFGFSIEGDELADGPFYNYSRCSTWSELARKIVLTYVAFDTSPPTFHLDGTLVVEMEDKSDSDDQPHSVARLPTIGREHIQKLMPLRFSRKIAENSSDIGTNFRKAMAFFMAFILHSIFGWSSFMINYTTPTVGMGCRSFLSMTYSLLSLFSCLLFIAASNCADTWSAQCQRLRWDSQNGTNEKLNSRTTNNQPNFVIAVASVICRLLGKAIAALNAIFIVVGCILEFAGVYQSCYCKSSYLGLVERAYVSFLSSEEEAAIARPFWYAGSGVAMATVVISCFGYFTKVHRSTRKK